MMRLSLLLSLQLVSFFSVRISFAETCAFSERLFDKVKVISEVDRKSGECITTLAPAFTLDGDYQIMSFSRDKVSRLISENFVDQEKIKDLKLKSALNGLPDLQFSKMTNQLLISWQKNWVMVSTISNQIMASNMPGIKSLTK